MFCYRCSGLDRACALKNCQEEPEKNEEQEAKQKLVNISKKVFLSFTYKKKNHQEVLYMLYSSYQKPISLVYINI